MINETSIKSGTKVRALTTRQHWVAGDEFIYRGSCEGGEFGWTVRLEGGEPLNLPGETPTDVGTASMPVDVFQTCFELAKEI